nr:fibrous sheath CABYR-binding protein-like [Anolis sagrei ordinatus]
MGRGLSRQLQQGPPPTEDAPAQDPPRAPLRTASHTSWFRKVRMRHPHRRVGPENTEDVPVAPPRPPEPQGTCAEEPSLQTHIKPPGTCAEEPSLQTHIKPQGTCAEEPSLQTHIKPQGTCAEEPSLPSHIIEVRPASKTSRATRNLRGGALSPDAHQATRNLRGGALSPDAHQATRNLRRGALSPDAHQATRNLRGGALSPDAHQATRNLHGGALSPDAHQATRNLRGGALSPDDAEHLFPPPPRTHIKPPGTCAEEPSLRTHIKPQETCTEEPSLPSHIIEVRPASKFLGREELPWADSSLEVQRGSLTSSERAESSFLSEKSPTPLQNKLPKDLGSKEVGIPSELFLPEWVALDLNTERRHCPMPSSGDEEGPPAETFRVAGSSQRNPAFR